MSDTKRIISVDAMGGDHAPLAVLGGMNQFLYQYGEDTVFFRVFGNERILRTMLKKFPRVARNCEIIHCNEVISGTDKVRDVIRHAQDTSMYMAVKDVRDGNSSAVVSAGNTGVLMALSKLALKTVDGISRPAITTMLPSGNGDTRVVGLDLGANVLCDEEILFDFSILGSVYAEIIGGMKRPRVGILNIGEEETKGSETLQRLNKILTEHAEELPYEYIGFVEGNDVTAGNVQVVVTDGFTGNVMLKTVEGTAKMISRIVKANYKRSIIAILGTFFLIHLFKRLKNKIDPRSYAGAVFLGLNGFSIKTHGNSDALAWAHALEYAANLCESDFYNIIRERTNALSNIKDEIKKVQNED